MNDSQYESLWSKESAEIQADLQAQRAEWEKQAAPSYGYRQWYKVVSGYFRLAIRMLESDVSLSGDPELVQAHEGLRVWYPAFEVFYCKSIEDETEPICIGVICAQDFTVDSFYKLKQVHNWIAHYRTFFTENGVLKLAKKERTTNSVTVSAAFDWMKTLYTFYLEDLEKGTWIERIRKLAASEDAGE